MLQHFKPVAFFHSVLIVFVVVVVVLTTLNYTTTVALTTFCNITFMLCNYCKQTCIKVISFTQMCVFVSPRLITDST